MTKLARLEDRADLQISIVLLASWAAITIAAKWGNWPPDLSALFMAGHFWSMEDFGQVYAAPPAFFGAGVESWALEIERLGFGGETFFPFVYPPIWAALAAPLAKTLGPAGFFNAFYVFHVSLIALSVVLSYRLIRPPVPLTLWCLICCVLLYISLIASSALFHNQLQITVTFLIILAFERYKKGASITAGIALGLAAALKITPAALGLIFLLDKDIRAALSTAATGLVLLALSLAVAGPEMHMTFLSRIGVISEQIALMHVNWNIESGLFQLWALSSGTVLHTLPEMPNMAVREPLWVSISTKALLILGAALVLWQTRNLSFENRLRTRPFGLLLILTLCAPLGWSHHYLPVLLLLPALLTFMAPVRAIILLAAFGGLTSLPVFSILMDYGQSVHLQALVSIATLIAAFLLFFAKPLTFPAQDRSRAI